MTTWYEYGPIAEGSQLLAFTKSVEQETQPTNSTQYAPTPAGPGRLSYWNGSGWHNLPDVRNVDLATLKGYALRLASVQLESDTGRLNMAYPSAERATWPQQLADAKAVLSESTTQPPMLSALASAAGTDVKTFSQKVLAKNDAYVSNYASVLASYQKLKASINNAADPSGLKPLTYTDLLLVLAG
jgi:hypothetical protein